jgi:hypothetical protein
MPREVVWGADANVGSGSTQSVGAGTRCRHGRLNAGVRLDVRVLALPLSER